MGDALPFLPCCPRAGLGSLHTVFVGRLRPGSVRGLSMRQLIAAPLKCPKWPAPHHGKPFASTHVSLS